MPSTATAPAEAPRTGQSVQSIKETTQVPTPLGLVKEFDVVAHQQEIAQVAYRIWLERADGPGTAEQDWLKAESEVQVKYSE